MGRIWRFIAGTRLRRIIVAVVVVGLAVVVTAIVGSRSSSTIQTSFSFDESCTSADVEANVRLTVYSSTGRSACEGIDRALGRQGSYWRVQEAAALEGELVCSLEKENTLVEVRDTGGHIYGNRFCAFFTGKGWTEQEGPGSQIEREKAQHETEAKEAQERQVREEEAERQRTAALEQHKREAQEKVERAKEAAEREHEEAKQHAQEAKEQEERKVEQAKQESEQHAQEAQEHREQRKTEEEDREQLRHDEEENARDNRQNEEETKRTQEEAEQANREAQ